MLFLNSSPTPDPSNTPHVGFSLANNTRCFITPLVAIFYIDLFDGSGERRLMLIWADMLDTAHYRHLCRILANYKQ